MRTPRDYRVEMAAPAPKGPPSSAGPALRALPGKLKALQLELVEMAFDLDLKGRLEAADLAMTTSARLGELCEEVETHPPGTALS
ncbi:MAG TPA: hypothetical protein VHO24_12440 [Opitutaceae bacterium]|nr:hypothetical protein [Opitutaceae bacterium]